MSPARSGWIPTAGALIYFTLATVWLTWPLLPRMGTALSGAPDSLLNAWALGWSFHILPERPFALFDANIFAPRPDTLAYSEHLFGIVATVWPVFAATGNLVLTYNVAFFASFVLSGLGMYFLVRELTGSAPAALAAGTVFLAAPYRFGHLLQIQLLSLQWLPFAFFSLLRFLRDGRPRQLLGIVFFSLLQILSCNYYAVYLAFALLLFGAMLLFTARELLTRRKLVLLFAGAALVTVATIPFLLPYERNRERGFYRRYEDLVHFSASPKDYWAPSSFNRAPHWKWLPRENRSEKTLFVGFGAILLAGIGVARRGRPEGSTRLFFRFALLLSLVAILLSFGPEIRFGDGVFHLPYRFLYRNLPGFSGMRVPARISVLTLFGVSILAGYGAAALVSLSEKRARLVALGTLAFLLFDYQTYSLERLFPEAPEISSADRWLAEAPREGAVLVLPIHEGEDIIHESLYIFFSTAHFRPLVNGYSGWWPNDYWELVGRLRHFPTSRTVRFLLDRAPVRYVVVHYDKIPEPRRRELEKGMERYRDSMPVAFRLGSDVVYEVRDPAEPR
jgi:hypothetical protein